jgi:hypothetical protein
MPSALVSATVAVMTSAPGRRPIRVDLDLVPDAEPIRGQVRSAGGPTEPFSGWLELIQLLERARITGPSGASGLSVVQEGENRP